MSKLAYQFLTIKDYNNHCLLKILQQTSLEAMDAGAE